MVMQARISQSTLQYYLSLTKPRVVVLHWVTAAAAMFLAASGSPPILTLLATLLGGGMVAGSANTLNCYLDREIDSRMFRTSRRPLPSGRLSPAHALMFGAALGLAGTSVLVGLVGVWAAVLSVAALAYYVLVYTLWLKRSTGWSAALASGVGAFPPLVGWVAVTGGFDIAPFFLAALIVLWTLPHFWSLAIFRWPEYEQAGIEAMPVKSAVSGIRVTSVLLVGMSVLAGPILGMGWLYLLTASILGVALLVRLRSLRGVGDPDGARRLFLFSVIYLPALFAAIILDSVLC
jgi:protoheme IX farnesyltransferase